MYRKSDIEDINEAQEEGNYYDDQALADVQISELDTEVESLQRSIATLIYERNEHLETIQLLMGIIEARVRWSPDEAAWAEEVMGKVRMAWV